jgi:hypothetical protein
MIPKDAFISPDDPFVRDPFRDALISPDDPFVPRAEEHGVVVGMNGSTACEAIGPTGLLLDLDQVTAALEALKVQLEENGIHGLRIQPGLSTFEVDLRNHLTEYFSEYD